MPSLETPNTTEIFPALTEAQLRRSLYTTTLLALLVPPFIGGTLMGLVGFYPLPEFYLIFTDYSLFYVLAVLSIALALVPRAHRFIVGLVHLERTQAEMRAHAAFARLPWILFGAVTLYSIFGALSADFSLEHMGIRKYTLREHLFNQFGLIPVVLITTFPIFFYFVDHLGRYLGPRGISVTAIPLWVKLLMLGIVTPLLIDSLLIGYYFNRTGYFKVETLGLWLSLLALAIGGTWIAWRSLRQGIAPLQAFITARGNTLAERAASLTPLSLDELGVLTARYSELLTTQKELAGDLQKAQSLANAVLENAGALVLVLDRAGRIVRFNHACERLSGYSYADIAGKFPWDSVLPPEEAENIRRMGFEARAQSYTNEWLSKDEQRYLIEWSNTLLLDSAGQMEFMVSVGIDITAREAAAVALRLSEHRLKVLAESLEMRVQERTAEAQIQIQRNALILSSTPDGFFAADTLGNFRMANPAFCAMLGYEEAELLRLSISDIEYQENAEEVTAHIEQVLTTGHDRFDSQHRRKDGSILAVELSTTLVDIAGEKLFYTFARDITPRQTTQQLLMQARDEAAQAGAMLRTVLDSAPYRIFWKDTEGRYLGSNRLFAEDAGKQTPQDLIGLNDYDMTWKASADLYRADDAQVLASDTPKLNFEEPMDLPDGSRIWLSTSKVPLHNEHGIVTGVLGAYDVITARKQIEIDLRAAKEAAEHASKAKSVFLSHMSHELRTPMNAILGFSQVLALDNLSAEQQDSVQEIYKAGEHLLELINELLDLSRIEVGKLSIVIAPVNVRAIITDALQLTQSLIEQHRISVLNLCDTDMSVLADSTRLKQILLNLLTNAAKYNRDGGSIRIQCQIRDSGLLRLSVSDNGPGLAPEQLDKLFTPFERLGAEFSAIDGTGIGLALAHKLAELMGTTLGVDSKPGQGSIFWIDLTLAPLSPLPNALANASQSSSMAQQQTFKVLYIEDNAANLKVVEAMLRRHPDLTLIAASNGEYGLELAQRYRPDAILLDIHLPGMDGYAVLAALQANSTTRDIPVLALSADAMPIDVEQGLKAGFVHYLTKPVKMDELVEALQTVLIAPQLNPRPPNTLAGN